MKVLFFSANTEAPFENLYKNLGLGNTLISNQATYIDQFSSYKEQLMDLVSEETDKVLFVPKAVKSTFLDWVKENPQIRWRRKPLSLELINPQIIGDDALDAFIADMKVEEEWESEQKTTVDYQIPKKSDYSPQNQGIMTIDRLFLLMLVAIIAFGLYNHFWPTPEKTKAELPHYQASENNDYQTITSETANEFDKEAAKALIKAIKETGSENLQASDVVILFDQTSSVVPPSQNGERLVTQVVETIEAFFSETTHIDRNLWSIQAGDEKKLKEQFQSTEKTLHLLSFGGAQQTSSNQCDIYLLPRAETLWSGSSALATEIKTFYWEHIFNNKILKEPDYESPQLAQWQAWKEIKPIQPIQQNYYQILITDGGKSSEQQAGDCQQDQTISTRINEWSQHYREKLLVLKYQGHASNRQNLTMTVSHIHATTDLPSKIAQLGNLLLSMSETAPAEKEVTSSSGVSIAQLRYAIDNLWVLIAAILVILMQAGFALLETGFNASKNVVNIMFKNVMDFSLGVLSFFLIGFTFMFGQTHFGLIGFDAFMLKSFPQLDISPYIFFLFQAAFAATAATICAGSVAGRLRFEIYLIYSIVITAIVYPISGHWAWGTGWLAGWFNPDWVFHDFAGSVVVHAVGGFAGLAGALVLKPRLGKFKEWDKQLLKDNKEIKKELNKRGIDELFPHNLLLAALGMLVLWIGWYGFNGGSGLGIYDKVESVANIVVNTTLSAAAGAVIVMFLAYLRREKLELTLMLNGAIGGLVGITALCDSVVFLEAILIGAVSGVIVLWGIELLVKWQVDDPVGAWPVHGLCGIWGGIAYAVFGYAQSPLFQIMGALIIPLWSFVTMFLLFWILNLLWKGGIRVSAEEELKGLDEHHHGEKALR